jgi:hypothetical protein
MKIYKNDISDNFFTMAKFSMTVDKINTLYMFYDKNKISLIVSVNGAVMIATNKEKIQFIKQAKALNIPINQTIL